MLGISTDHMITNLFFTNYKTSFMDPLQYLRIISHIFGHVNWEHFSGNFLIILLLGPMLEEKYGSKAFIEMIFVTALVTGLINTFAFQTGLLGASGIVFMFILLSSFANAKAGKIPLTLLIVIIIFLGKEVINGLVVRDNISQITHIIGGFCGGIFGYYISR
jgi:rhomboid protease GluP